MKASDAMSWTVALVAALVLQVGVFDQIKLSGYINPQIVPALFLAAKLFLPKYLHLLLSFLTGLAIDWWYNTGGIYASALSMISFIPSERLLGLLVTSDPGIIRVSTVGFRRYFVFISISYVVFFAWLYLLDSMASVKFLALGSKIMYSTAISLLIIVPIEILLTPDATRVGKRKM